MNGSQTSYSCPSSSRIVGGLAWLGLALFAPVALRERLAFGGSR
jgi:hypothetical protein